MTCRPEKLLAALLLGAAVLAAPLAAAPGDDAIAEALDALDRGDGVAAELAGKRALEEGAPRAAVAALVGEGELLQGDFADARQWLGEADFSVETRARGLHALARLEVSEEDFAAAIAAYEQRLALGDETAPLWVDIGRMRYRIGDHQLALEAARRAVELDGEDPRALEFLAQLTRDAEGLRAALPLFRRALELSPADVDLMGHYAATLGDAGENARMLVVARALLEEDDRAPMGFFLQAVLAARAGEDDLARRLWWRTEGAFDAMAVGLTVTGVLEYRSGNPAVAAEKFNELRRLQPFNDTALLMYARALVANGEANVAIALLEPHAQRPDATPYMLVLAARAHEQRGERDRAGQYLDRAARLARASTSPLPAFLPRDGSGRIDNPENPVLQMRQMLSEGRASEARTMVAGFLGQFAGSADLQVVAGDVELLAGNSIAALEHYRQAGMVRSDWPLVRRMVAALATEDRTAEARNLLAAHLMQNPRQQQAAALLGRMQRDAGNPARATALLRYAASVGAGPRDPLLVADLAELEVLVGNPDRALASAAVAHALQRGNARVAQVFGRINAMAGNEPASAVLLAKAAGRGLAPPQ
jgi:cellulose synthase operon protein C